MTFVKHINQNWVTLYDFVLNINELVAILPYNQTIMNLVIKAFRRYWLTIIGSLILVVSWYFEKSLTTNHENQISDFKENRFHYILQNQSKIFATYVSEITAFNYKHDTILSIADLTDAYSAELRMIEHLKVAGIEMSMRGDESKDELNNQYDSRITLINKLQDEDNNGEIKKMLAEERTNFYEISKNNQLEVNRKIIKENESIHKIHFWTLFLYALGIILITMDKVKETVYNKNEVKSLPIRNKVKNTKKR